jgi:hypothetical protein
MRQKNYKMYAIWQTNDSLSRRHPLPLEIQACHLDHNIRCPAIQVAMNESLKMTWRNETLKSCESVLFFSFRISSQQASSQFPVHLLLLAARSSHFPQTPWCQLQSVQVTQPTSKPSWSSPQTHAQVPQLLQGRFASEFQQCGQERAIDHGSSATWRHLQHCTY